MNKYLIKLISFPMFIAFGCASVDQRSTPAESQESRRLEKRIDDLSGKITLIVNDTNRLHNKMEEVNTFNSTIQQKMEGLETVVRNLNEQFLNFHASAKIQETVQPPAIKRERNILLPPAEIRTPSEKPEYDVHKTIYADSQLAVAREFWDAMNAKDIQAVRSCVTKESADKLHLNEEAADGFNVTFGVINIVDGKTTIETLPQTNDGTTEFHARMQTILVKEEGQWKVDAEQTMMAMFGGARDEMLEGFGNEMKETLMNGTEDTGTSMAEGMQKGVEGVTQTSVITPEVEPTKPEYIPQTLQTAVNSEQEKRELFIKNNIVRLAEAEFPDSKGILWNILSFDHTTHLSCVKVEPTHAINGSPRFEFIVSFEIPEKPRVIRILCFKEGKYRLFRAKDK